VKLSIVTPCFNEEDSIQYCVDEVARVMRERLPDYDYEHIFSDNASTDRTVEILRAAAAQDSHVKVVVNSRNVGPMRNTVNALNHVSGDLVVPFVPADLQDPPDMIPTLLDALEPDLDVVYGVRSDRREPFVLRTSRDLYYRLVSLTSGGRTPPSHAGDFLLARRHIVDAVVAASGNQSYLRGMVAMTEPRYTVRPYPWGIREQGVSRNSLGSLIDQGFLGFVETARAPLRWALPLGIVVSILGVIYALATIVLYLLDIGRSDPGIATIIVGVFLFGGLQLFILGVVGEYVLSVHRAVNPPPPVVERERINF
jgi:glycosyltransferase involved in cell wall biosynthesis